MKFRLLISSIIIALSLNVIAEPENNKFPTTAKDKRWQEMGSVLGGKSGGVDLLGENSGGGILGGSRSSTFVGPVWQATIETIGFMPLNSADSSSGAIITDWYEDPNHPGERFKLNIFIKSKKLDLSSIEVKLFKQKLQGNLWRDLPSSEAMEKDIRDKILNNARKKLANNKK